VTVTAGTGPSGESLVADPIVYLSIVESPTTAILVLRAASLSAEGSIARMWPGEPTTERMERA
jgi:hypothetical protein